MPQMFAPLCAIAIALCGTLSGGSQPRPRMPSQKPHNDQSLSTREVIEALNDAINGHDAARVAQFLTDDTVFEDTSPAPDGKRYEGKQAVVAFWERWFAANPDARFEAEEIVTAGDRAVVRWVYHKMRAGQPWHLRGVDVFTVRNGKVAAKLAYVKG